MTRPVFKSVYEQAEETIRSRMLERVSDAWRKDPGDFIYDVIAASPAEIVELQKGQDELLKRSFAQYSGGEWLDLKLTEIGLTRISATAAKRRLEINADAGVKIPLGHVASTVTLLSEGSPLQYTVDEDVSFTAPGKKSISITCKNPGAVGNVLDGTEFILLPPIPGIKEIVDRGVTVPGQDTESDEDAYSRYEFKVRHPDTGGNKNDYVRWVQPLDGVGKLRVIPRWNGNGTVKVILVGDDFLPATPTVVANVQQFLDPILNVVQEMELTTLTGYGASVDTSQADASGKSVVMAYNASGAGVATLAGIDSLLETENHFKARIRVKVDSVVGTSNLLQIRILDTTTGQPVKQTKGGAQSADIIYKANQLAAAFTFVEIPFYYDGNQGLKLEVRRLGTDTTTTLWVDQVNYVGVYGQGLGYGQAPGGARVFVKAADQLPLNIAATVTYVAGADKAAVAAAFRATVNKYLQEEVIFVDNAKIVIAKVGALLITTPGVVNYAALTINGGTTDIIPGKEETPAIGTVNI